MASAADIEQMNKVRLSLGLEPLEVPGQGPRFREADDQSDGEESDDLSTLEKRTAAASSNWQKHEAERVDKEERQKRKDAAKKAREAAARFEKLEGKGLGEAEGDGDVDARTWLKQQKKRQKKIEQARKLEEELAAREQQAAYTSMDLAGVKVGHEASQFDDFTGEQVLTLKDAEIGEESEDDELENAELKAKEKLEERLRLKKKRPDYDPTDQGENQGVLSKYDEEIDGKLQKRFTLDGQGSTREARSNAIATDESKSKGIKINLDILQDDIPVSDYVDPSTIKVKKAKKGKNEKKTRRKATEEDYDISQTSQLNISSGDRMDLDANTTGPNATKKRNLEFDDEDLQARLAEQRRQTLKKRKKTDASELARQMQDEMPIDEVEPEDGALIIDETSEFVANLKRPEDVEEAIRLRKPALADSVQVKEDNDDDDDVNMGEQSYAEVDDEEDREDRIKREALTSTDMTATGLEDEETVDQGVGAMVTMLRKRGLVAGSSSEELALKERQRAEFLESKSHLLEEYDQKAREQREADRRSGRFDKMTNRERDTLARQQNEQREQFIARLLADKFNKEYRPDVKLRYNDEYGRDMGQKEAFKHLSHMFHGKGSGKLKTEKRLKKIEEEKRNAAKGILNVSEEGGFSNVQGREGKRQKTAGVRLQ